VEVVDKICRPLAERLWAVYRDEVDGPSLILPAKRDGSRRVSEQESKILLCQIADEQGIPYSIETPTSDTYQQSGTYAMSARIDVTLYSADASR